MGYCNASLCWVQEEHKNMGAWSYVQPRTQTAIGGYHRLLQYIGRETAPSPATATRQHTRGSSRSSLTKPCPCNQLIMYHIYIYFDILFEMWSISTILVNSFV